MPDIVSLSLLLLLRLATIHRVKIEGSGNAKSTSSDIVGKLLDIAYIQHIWQAEHRVDRRRNTRRYQPIFVRFGRHDHYPNATIRA